MLCVTLNPLDGLAWITIFEFENGSTVKTLNDSKMQNNVFMFFDYATEAFAFFAEVGTWARFDCRLAYAALIKEVNIGCGLRGFDCSSG